MVREIKKEQGLLDALFGIPEKEIIYEDGRKIGEVRQETTLLGDRIERVYDAEGNKVLDKYIEIPVKLDNMAIFPGSTIILDNNELSISLYLEEDPFLDG